MAAACLMASKLKDDFIQATARSGSLVIRGQVVALPAIAQTP